MEISQNGLTEVNESQEVASQLNLEGNSSILAGGQQGKGQETDGVTLVEKEELRGQTSGQASESQSSITKDIDMSDSDESLTQEVSEVADVSDKEDIYTQLDRIRDEYGKEVSDRVSEMLTNEYFRYDHLENALKAVGFNGEIDDVMMSLRGKNDGSYENEYIKSTQEYQSLERELKSKNDMLMKTIHELRKVEFDKDLTSIKAVYPELEASSVWDLGSNYATLMASGIFDPLTAYETSKLLKERSTKQLPPTMGSFASSESTGEKMYYSPKDVDRLSRDDYNNPRIIQRIRKSMTKWK